MKTKANHVIHGPSTKLGKWSIGLIITMPLLFIVGTALTSALYADVPAGGSIMEDIAARPALALTMLTGMAAGIGAFLIGLLAIMSQKERSFLVFIATAIGALLIIFLAGEFAFPH